MAGVVIRGIKEDSLSGEDRSALAILRGLPVEKLNRMKQLLKLGDPGVVGPQTLSAFRQLLEGHDFDLSSAGVNAFKEAHQLGNTGRQHGVIGPQAAGAYLDELLNRIAAEGELAVVRKLLAITGAFEGAAGPRFATLAGDFDRQGVSFGVLQWNFGSGTLAPLLKRMLRRDPTHFRATFGEDAARFVSVLGAERASQLRFARGINDARNRIMEPWRSRFVRLGEHPAFQEVQMEFASALVGKARRLAAKYGLRTERGLALMYDIVVQNGTVIPKAAAAVRKARTERERALGRALTEREFLEIIATAVADAASPVWRADVLARKMCIVHGTGVVHGSRVNLDTRAGLSDALVA